MDTTRNHEAWKKREAAAAPRPTITPEQRARDIAEYHAQLAAINARRGADDWVDALEGKA